MNLAMIFVGGITAIILLVMGLCEQEKTFIKVGLVSFVICLWGLLATCVQDFTSEILEPLSVMTVTVPDGSSTVTYGIDNSGKAYRYSLDLKEGYGLSRKYTKGGGGWALGVYCVQNDSTNVIIATKIEELEKK